ncbi:efflux RND transporter periplasmic adaptor subunit [bacterium]|nr:MAG: efflux RND transporter periplasmic adaptor subunit [bacterium]
MAKSGTGSGKRLLIIVAAVIVLLIIIAVAGRSMGVFGQKKTGKEVETAQAKLKTITSIVEASGKIQPEIEVIITPDVSGEIIELYVKEGDVVKNGDVLLRINPDVYQASVEQLKANLLSMKANLETGKANLIRSKANFTRQEELFNKGLVSEMDYISAKSSFQADQASLKASEYSVQNAEAQLDRAQKELARTTILAPMDGTVSKLNVEKGERVVGAIQMTGTEVMRIARLEQMEVQVKVNENDIVNVAYGDTASIQVDSYPGKEFYGVVTEIANSATLSGTGTTEQVTDYDVKIRITTAHNNERSKGRLIQAVATTEGKADFVPNFKPGMSASVDIRTETVVNVVSVPIQSVTARDFSKLKKKKEAKDSAKTDSTTAVADTSKNDDKASDDLLIPKEDLRRVVFVVIDGKAVMREVQTGISDDTHIQILVGVTAGEHVVIGPYRILSADLADDDDVTINNDKFKKISS